jgi:hypothetical protein
MHQSNETDIEKRARDSIFAPGVASCRVLQVSSFVLTIGLGPTTTARGFVLLLRLSHGEPLEDQRLDLPGRPEAAEGNP